MIIDGHQPVLKNAAEQIQINKSCNIDKVVLFSTVVHPETANTRAEFACEMNKLNKILRGELNPAEERRKAIDGQSPLWGAKQELSLCRILCHSERRQRIIKIRYHYSK